MISKVSTFLGPNGLYSGKGATPSLVLSLDANSLLSYDGTSSTWYDLSVRKNNGLLNNVTSVTGSIPSKSLSFDGSNSYISFTQSDGIPLGNSPYTIEVWFNSNSYSPGEQGPFLGWGTTGVTDATNVFRLSGNGLYNYWWGDDLNITFAGTSSMIVGNWYYAVATFDGTNRSIYLNGELKSSAAPSGVHNVTDATTLQIGHFYNSYFNGRISKVKISDKSLPDSKILSNFNTDKITYGYEFGSMNFNDTQSPYLISTSNDYAFGTNDFTIEAFFKLSLSSYGYTGVISQRHVGQFKPSINIQQASTSTPLIEFCSLSGWLVYTASNDTWYHTAISRTGGTTSYYVNGELFNQVSDTTNYTDDTLVVGRYYTEYDNYYFNGIISNVRVINGTGLYSGSTITVPTPKLNATADTKFLINSQKTTPTVDLSGNLQSVTASNIGWTASLPYFTPPYISDHLELYVDPSVSESYSPSIGGSIQFAGTDQYISTDVTAPGTYSLTYEMWFYQTNNSPTTQGLIQTRTNTLDADGIDVSVVSGQIFIGTSGAGLLTGGIVHLNTWYHIAVVRNGDSAWTAYLNGKSFGTFNFTNTTGTQLSIGRKSATTYDEFFIGYISNFRYTRDNVVYTGNFTPPIEELTAITGTDLLLKTKTSGTTFDDTSGNSRVMSVQGATFSSLKVVGLKDLSTNGFDMIIGTGSYWTADSGGVIHFDGTYPGPIDYDGPTSTTSVVGVTYSTGYSMEVMVKFDNVSGSRGIFTFCGNVWASSGYIDLQLDGQSLRWEVTGNSITSLFPSYTFNTGTWYHIVATYDGNFSVVYVNGTMVGSNAGNGINTTYKTAKFVLGSWDGPLHGDIGFARFYSKPLLAADVTNNFDSSKTRFGL